MQQRRPVGKRPLSIPQSGAERALLTCNFNGMSDLDQPSRTERHVAGRADFCFRKPSISPASRAAPCPRPAKTC